MSGPITTPESAASAAGVGMRRYRQDAAAYLPYYGDAARACEVAAETYGRYLGYYIGCRARECAGDWMREKGQL